MRHPGTNHAPQGARPLGRPRSAHFLIAALVLMPLAAYANPVSLDGQSLIAFWIVAFWALIIESGLATLAVASCGLLIVPLFMALVTANVSVFAVAFMPLTQRVPLWLLEPGVVLADALIIKLLVAAPLLQGGDYVGVTWRRALAASFLGNASSYFIGLIGSYAPWHVHQATGD